MKNNDMITSICYVTYQLLFSINNAYYMNSMHVIQPKNRDTSITQNRQEVLGSAYVLPDYHINFFNALIQYGNGIADRRRVKYLLLARYITSLRQVELEFYYSVSSEDFKRRNNCLQSKPSDWLKNGYIYTKNVVKNKLLPNYKIKHIIILEFIWYSFIYMLWIKIIHRKTNSQCTD